jgi:O-antigen/teichoic acid export membrane protein
VLPMAEAHPTGGSLTARAFWLISAKTLAFVLSFALPLILVRRLSQAEFGLYKQAFLVVGTAAAVLPLSFVMSAFYFLPRERGRQGAVVLNILIFNSLVGGAALLVLLARPGLLGAIFNSPALVPYAPLIGLLIFFWIVSYFLEIGSIANQDSKLSAAFIVGSQLTKTALLVSAAVFFSSVGALLYAAVAQGALQTVALVIYLRWRFGPFWRGFDWGVMRRQLAYALPLGLGAILYVAMADMHNYFVSYRFGEAAFAVYAVGCFSLPLVGIIMESVGTVMIARVSQLQSEGDARGIVEVTAAAMRKLAAVYFPLYALLLVVGREFIHFLFTERYAASWPVFAVNLTTLPFLVLIADPIIRAHAEHRFFLLKVRAVTILLLFGALWLATDRFGLLGAVAAMVAASVADRLIEAFKAWSIVGVTRRDVGLLKDVGKVGVAAAAAACVTAAARLLFAGARPFYVLAACGAVFGCVYLALLLALGVPTAEEREMVRGKLGLVQRLRFGRRRAADPLV